jgi:DNA polymerase-3 subunit gamma/tau
MSYLVLARKYRPQTFEELVGQEHVTTTLVNALESRRLAHAYIFSGPRGCGKTTTARILAKALNCVKGPTAHPCGECPLCREILAGTCPDDVIEIDGASNRGIDQIRELRDTVKYAPVRGRYRIYIIDEAHQITEAGFNALLKTLEEPPPHAVFMMATTEAQKIPGTILSRCQRFQLKPISPLDTQKQLKKILEKENMTVGDEALLEVARASHGSLRDALSLLDQAVANGPRGVTGEQIRSLLGFLPQEQVKNFVETIDSGSSEKVLGAVQKAVEEGFDLFQLAEDLLEHHHGRLLAEAAHDTGLLERRLRILSRCLSDMRRSASPRITFELACLDMAQETVSVDELLERLENLEKLLDEKTPRTPPSPPLGTMSLRGTSPTRPTPASLPQAWTKLLEDARDKKPLLQNFLLKARWENQPGNILHIICGGDFHKQQILPHLSFIQESLEKNTGQKLSVQCVLGTIPVTSVEEVADDPRVNDPRIDDPVEDPPTQTAPNGHSPDGHSSPEPRDNVPRADGPRADGPRTTKTVETEPPADPGLQKLLDKFPGKLKKLV